MLLSLSLGISVVPVPLHVSALTPRKMKFLPQFRFADRKMHMPVKTRTFNIHAINQETSKISSPAVNIFVERNLR